MASSPVPLLLVTSDATTREEFASALAALRDGAFTPYVESDHHLAVEQARARRPRLVLIEMSPSLDAALSLARELRLVCPEIPLAGVFRPDRLPADASESAVLIEALRSGMHDFLRRPLSSLELAQLFERRPLAAAGSSVALGRVAAYASNKGGVGKSTLAVNTACELARRHPDRVLLIDASLQMGVCATLLNLAPTTTLHDAIRQRDRLDPTLLRQLTTPHASGLQLLAAPTNPVESTEIDDAMLASVLSVARRSFDFVVVDTFPLLDQIVMTVLDVCDTVFVVLDNVVPTILSGVKFFEMLDAVRFPAERRVVVLNRYRSTTGNPRPADVAARLRQNVEFQLPYDERVMTAANTGRPLILAPPWWSGFCRETRRMADFLERLEAPHGNGA